MWSYWLQTHDGVRQLRPTGRRRHRRGRRARRPRRHAARPGPPVAARGRSYSGASSSSDLAGTSASTSPSSASSTRSRPEPVTRPMTVARMSQRRAISSTSSTLDGSTMANIRSCDSEVMTSNGSMWSSRWGIGAIHTSMPAPPLAAVSAVAHVMPAPPRSCTPRARSRSSSSRQASIKPLLLERVADLHAGSLGGIGLAVGEAGRGEHRDAPDPVASGRRTEQHRQVSGSLGACQHQPLDRHHAEAEDVDQRVVGVRLVEDGLTTDRRHAHRVPVARHARHDAFGDPPRPGVVQRPEAQRIHDRNGPRPDREDVAEDPADAGCRALIGLDGGGMVVTLDADGRGDAVADIDHPCALTGADQDPRRRGGEPLQVDPGALVRTVLGPHDRVHRQLEVVGLTSQRRTDPLELVVGEPQGPMGRLGHSRDATSTDGTCWTGGCPGRQLPISQ